MTHLFPTAAGFPTHQRIQKPASQPKRSGLFGLNRRRRVLLEDRLSDHLLDDIGISRADLAAMSCPDHRG